MNRFQNGTWPFRSSANDAPPKQWQVTYWYRIGNRQAVQLFETEAAAQAFADATGGTVKEREFRGGYK